MAMSLIITFKMAFKKRQLKIQSQRVQHRSVAGRKTAAGFRTYERHDGTKHGDIKA